VIQLLQSIVEASQNVAETLQSADSDSSSNDSWLAWFFGGNIDFHTSRLVLSFMLHIVLVISSVMLLSVSGSGWLVRHIAVVGKMETDSYFSCPAVNVYTLFDVT